MTVTAAETRVEYSGNGTTTVFTYPYQFFQNDDLNVWLFPEPEGPGIEQVLGVDYTVTGAMNPSGGNITMTVAPPSGTTLIIINDPDIIQTTHYVNADDFPADSHEQALDRLTKICQRLSDRIDRAVRAPDYAPEDQVPDAATLVGLVDEAQAAATEAAASADQAESFKDDAVNSANNAAADAADAASAASAAAASEAAAAASAGAAAASEAGAEAAAAAAQVDKIEWKGNWSGSVAYEPRDAVQSGGSSWISKTANTNKDPATNPSDWDLLAQKGQPGAPGAGTGDMLGANNLSDVTNVAQSRTNLGLGNAAVLSVGQTAGTVAAGDDSRFASLAASDALKAPLASPSFTGNPTAPTPTAGDNDTSLATTAFVKNAVDTAAASGPPANSVDFGDLKAAAIATAAEYRSNVASKLLTTDQVWAAAAPVALADAASVAPDFSTGLDFSWNIGAASRTLANPTNVKSGQKGYIRLINSSGTVTSWGTAYKFPGGTKPVPVVGQVDILSYVVIDASNIYCAFSAGFA